MREDAVVGSGCIVGRGAYVGPGVRMGDGCKLQNYALVYEPAVLEDGVFVGPAAVLTNDLYPRAITPDGTVKTGDDWQAVGVTIRDRRRDRRPGGVRGAGDDRPVGDRRGGRRRDRRRAGLRARRRGTRQAHPLGRPRRRAAGAHRRTTAGAAPSTGDEFTEADGVLREAPSNASSSPLNDIGYFFSTTPIRLSSPYSSQTGETPGEGPGKGRPADDRMHRLLILL